MPLLSLDKNEISTSSHILDVFYFMKYLDFTINFTWHYDSNLSCYVHKSTTYGKSFPYIYSEQYHLVKIEIFPLQQKPLQGLWH